MPALLLAGFVAAACLSAPGAASAASCPHENAKPGQASRSQFAVSIRCLVNEEREKRDLRGVSKNRDLGSVERSHIKRMLAKHCFAHRCGNEKSLPWRIKRSGYVSAGNSFDYGENLGFEGTPKEMIDRFMGDPGHRANVLLEQARNIGVATGFGSPKRGDDDARFVTYAILIAGRTH